MRTDEDAIGIMLGRLEASAPEELLSRADAELLLGLPEDRRDLGLRRLAVMRAWNGPDRSAFDDAAQAAARAGMSRSAFFAMTRKRGRLGIADLGLRISGPGIEAGVATRAAAAREAIGRVLKETPAAAMGDIVASLREAGVDLAASRIARLVDEVRTAAGPTGAFGSRIRWDAAGLDLVDADGARQRLFGLVDQATAIVLGWSIASEASFPDGYRAAARMALDRARAPVPEGVMSRLATADQAEVSIALPGSSARYDLEDARPAQGWTRVSDPRRVGRAIVSALGTRIGGVAIGAGTKGSGVSYRYGRAVAISTLTERLSLEVDEAIAAHDLHRAGLALEGRGSAADVVEAVALPMANLIL